MTDEKQNPDTYDRTYAKARPAAKSMEDEELVHTIAAALKSLDHENPFFLAIADAWGEESERRARHRIDAPRADRVAAALREIRDGSTIGYQGQAYHILDILKNELLPDPWCPIAYQEQQEPQPSVRDEIRAYLLRTTTISHADAERHAHQIANICFGEEATP